EENPKLMHPDQREACDFGGNEEKHSRSSEGDMNSIHASEHASKITNRRSANSQSYPSFRKSLPSGEEGCTFRVKIQASISVRSARQLLPILYPGRPSDPPVSTHWENHSLTVRTDTSSISATSSARRLSRFFMITFPSRCSVQTWMR